ncbi:MAG: STAS domain-containing protein [Actinomycetota bacterium]|nr:STAS domain-containing protein [Actinomycetota bacterium]
MDPIADLEVTGRTGRLVLRGEIDTLVIDDVRAAVDRAHEKHVTSLDVDLAQVDFMDSSGLGVIAQAAADFERLRVVAAPITVIRILELTGLGGFLAIGGDDTAGS